MNLAHERDLVSDAFHRKRIVSPVQVDPRSISKKNSLFGNSIQRVRFKIIQNGKCDFDRGFQDQWSKLSPDDLVSLYCYLYWPRHHGELLATFDRFEASIKELFTSNNPTWIVDLGSGPGTVALAVADAFGRPPFHYLGIDRSLAMRKAARNFLRLARGDGLLDRNSRIATASDTSRLSDSLSRCRSPINVIFVASFFFASSTLNIQSLSQDVRAVLRHEVVDRSHFVYVNSVSPSANRQYAPFLDLLQHPVKSTGLQEQHVKYCGYAARYVKTSRIVNDCLILKGEK
jgi:SAM-dependent methyltransferase